MIQPFLLILIALLTVATPATGSTLPLEQLKMPDGFTIEVYAEVENARQMAAGGKGIVYVGSRRAGKVHAVIDNNGDGKADRVVLIDEELNLPTGLAYRNGSLYVGAVSTIYRYDNIDQQLDNPPEPVVVVDNLPTERHHGWKFLAFGPDNLLYVPVGAPCNICLSEDPRYASILTMDPDIGASSFEIYAEGVRNTVGFDWHPTTGELWFTDNGRDLLGDDIPPCELNRAPARGMHFGYPFFHGDNLADPEFGANKSPDAYVTPALNLTPHSAPLGMMFYTGKQFPAKYHNQVIIPEHGSWNRTPEAGHTGYSLTLGLLKADGNVEYETFINGWLGDDNKYWGRPVHLITEQDGSILLSDGFAGVIYRIRYVGS